MKKKKSPFLCGCLMAVILTITSVSALAITGRMSIDVDPINIQVNGQIFSPKDATGADVPVFAYQGTTYAPLRALAEAYGLEVGYDVASNMATVSKKQPIQISYYEHSPSLIDFGAIFDEELVIGTSIVHDNGRELCDYLYDPASFTDENLEQYVALLQQAGFEKQEEYGSIFSGINSAGEDVSISKYDDNDYGMIRIYQAQNHTPSSLVSMYSLYPDIPDFGAFYGITPSTVIKSKTAMATSYVYKVKDMNDKKVDITMYYDVLETLGLRFSTSFEGTGGNEVKVYTNGIYSVQCGRLSQTDFLVMPIFEL